jgi:hypothetical protein
MSSVSADAAERIWRDTESVLSIIPADPNAQNPGSKLRDSEILPGCGFVKPIATESSIATRKSRGC